MNRILKGATIGGGIVAFVGLLQGCSVSQLSPEAQNVRVINEAQAKSCRFLDSVNANSRNTLSENPEQEARVQAMNRVAALSGNALRIISTNQQMSSSGVGSLFIITGEAYRCG